MNGEMTDKEIYAQAKTEWLALILKLWTAYGKEPEKDRVVLYAESLEFIPYGLLTLAVKRTIANHKYNSVPTIADVMNAARAELGNPADPIDAARAWRPQAALAWIMTPDGMERMR